MLNLTEKQCEALRILEEKDGNLKETARELGIGLCSLKNRLEKIRNNTAYDPMFPFERRHLLELIEESNRAKAATEGEIPFKRCDRPCRYRASEYAINGCDYLSITGHSRGCPPCEECTKFEEGERLTVIMDEWKVPKLPSVEEIDVYTIQKVRKRLHYAASVNR